MKSRIMAVFILCLALPVFLGAQTRTQVGSLVPRIGKALNKGDRDLAVWYMARHIGLSLRLHYKIDVIALMKLQMRMNLTNFGLFSANLDPGMIDWFVTKSLFNWGAAPDQADESSRTAVIRIDTNREYSVSVSGRPSAQEWTVMGSRMPAEKAFLLVCDNRHPPELNVTVRSNGSRLGPVSFGSTNEYVHTVLPAVFYDFDADSRAEIGIRYNVCRKDGLFQKLDLYKCKADPSPRLVLWKSFTGGPTGAATVISNGIVMTFHAVPGGTNQNWLIWNRSRIEYFKPDKSDFKLLRTEERTNFLMTEDYWAFYPQ